MNKLSKRLFNSFIYCSIIFLAIYLYKNNLLKIPRILAYWKIFLSFFFLFYGFLIDCISFQKTLNETGFHTNIKDCVSAQGLSIFGKYIPGKLWTIIGRAGYISKKKNYHYNKISIISLNAQFLNLWVGLILGSIGLIIFKGLYLWGWMILTLFILLTMIIFSRFFHNIIESILNRFIKRKFDIPYIKIKSILSIIHWFALTWIFWSYGFFLLVSSLINISIPLSIGLGFPLAGTLGIMAVIAPGGLGVREGVLVGYLSLSGLSVPEAATIAVASRLWFLIGEVFIFFLGIFVSKFKKNNNG